MKQIYSTILILILTKAGLLACTITPETFCRTSNLFSSNIVLVGQISSVDIDGIDLEVIEVLRGEENRTTIRIWDGTDFDCNGIWSMAAENLGEIGDSIVVILPPTIEEIVNEWDVIGDYRTPAIYSFTPNLKIENGQVVGLIQGDAIAPPEFNTLSIAYDTFANWWNLHDDCFGISVATENLIKNNEEINYTNPVESSLHIDFKNSNSTRVIEIYNLQGIKLLRKEVPNNRIEIDLSFYQKGIYYISVQDDRLRYEGLKMTKM